jgi:hypothetical protein
MTRELCDACCCSVGHRESSFSSAAQSPDIQDYDNDALVVHMGAFEPPAGPQNQPHSSKQQAADAPGATSDSSPPSTPSAAGDERDVVHPLRSKDAADAAGELVGAADLVKHKGAARGSGARKQKVVHLYAVAAPGMRRVPTSTRDIMQCLSWAAPVELKRQWAKVQKGYFDAPGRLWWWCLWTPGLHTCLWAAVCSKAKYVVEVYAAARVWPQGVLHVLCVLPI